MVSDGFAGPDKWTTLLPGKDRVALDLHRYLVSIESMPLIIATYRLVSRRSSYLRSIKILYRLKSFVRVDGPPQ